MYYNLEKESALDKKELNKEILYENKSLLKGKEISIAIIEGSIFCGVE